MDGFGSNSSILWSCYRAGALRGLGEHCSKAGFDYLVGRINPGLEPERARPAVLDGMTASAAFQTDKDEKLAIGLLAECLLDEYDAVRNTACSSLISLEARDKAGDIEAVSPQMAHKSMCHLVIFSPKTSLWFSGRIKPNHSSFAVCANCASQVEQVLASA